jgi:hypothetical protein
MITNVFTSKHAPFSGLPPAAERNLHRGHKSVHRGTHIAILLLIAVFLILATAACKKKNTVSELGPNVNVADDIVFAERGLFHTFDLLFKANLDSNIMVNGAGTIDRAIITYNSTLRRFSVFYQNKYCADSVTRNGNIVITLTGDFFTTATEATVVFQNYSEDSRKFIGKDNLINYGFVLGGHSGYNSTIVGLSIVKDSLHSTVWNSLLDYHIPTVIKMNPDSIAPINITGTANGVSSATYAFSFQISTPLVNDIYCPWIRQGIMQISVPSADVADGTIEYVNSLKCNDRVTYNFEGTVCEWWINKRKLNY